MYIVHVLLKFATPKWFTGTFVAISRRVFQQGYLMKYLEHLHSSFVSWCVYLEEYLEHCHTRFVSWCVFQQGLS